MAQAHLLDVSGNDTAAGGDLHAVSDLKRFEDREDESVNDIAQALLEDKAQYHDDERTGHQQRLSDILQFRRKGDDADEGDNHEKSFQNPLEEGILDIGRTFFVSPSEDHLDHLKQQPADNDVDDGYDHPVIGKVIGNLSQNYASICVLADHSQSGVISSRSREEDRRIVMNSSPVIVSFS